MRVPDLKRGVLDGVPDPFRFAGACEDSPTGPALVKEATSADRLSELAERELRTRRILDASLDAVIAMDASGGVIEWNRQAEVLFGRSREDVLGRPLVELIIPEEHRAAHRAGLQTYLATGEGPILGKRIELMALRADGSEFPVELTVTAFQGPGAPSFSASLRDVTHAREVEEALRSASERLQSVIETAPSGIVVVNADGAITLANHAAEEMFGYAGEEMVGASIERLVAGSVRERHAQERAEYLQDPQTRLMGVGRDLFAVRKDGSEFPVEVGLAVAETDEGPLVTAIVTDISERAREQGRTQRALERLRHITEIDRKILESDSIDEVAEAALEGIREQIPQVVRAVLGLVDRGTDELEAYAVVSEEEIGVPVGARVPLGSAPGIDRLARGETVLVPDVAHAGDTNVAVDALMEAGIRSLVVVPVMSEGEMVGSLSLSSRLIGSFSEDDLALTRDVAAQLSIGIRTAELRRELEERAWRMESLHEVERAILSSMSISEVAHAALANLQQRVAATWAAVVRFSEGRVHAEVLAIEPASVPAWMSDGAHIPDVGDISDLRAGAVRVVADTREEPSEHVIARRLAEQGILSYTVVPMIVDVDLVGGLIILADRTGVLESQHLDVAREVADSLAIAIHRSELRLALEGYAAELEERVESRTAELSEMNEQLDAFAYSVSHDLRAPLRAMEGFSQALLEDYGAALGEEGRDYAERVVRAAEKMDELIRDLLAYSRLTRAELPLGQVQLGPIVDEAIQVVRADPASQQAEITSEGTFPSVIGHRSTLHQVVTNLLTNAVKFVDEGVSPSIRVWSEVRGPVVRLCVRDNGIGIEPEFHAKVFGVLERLHGVERFSGTGIGLAIVAKGAERMDGSAGLESEPGRGSTFWVDLKALEGRDGG